MFGDWPSTPCSEIWSDMSGGARALALTLVLVLSCRECLTIRSATVNVGGILFLLPGKESRERGERVRVRIQKRKAEEAAEEEDRETQNAIGQ